MIWMLGALLSAALLSGCVHGASIRFREEYGCKTGKLTNLGGGAVRVKGCGREVTYVCGERLCVKEQVESTADKEYVGRPPSTPGRGNAPFASAASGVVRTKHPEGYVLLELSSHLGDARSRLAVRGAPQRDADNVLLVFSQSEARGALAACELRAVLDGEATVLPEVHHQSQGTVDELRMKFPMTQLMELARAQRFVAQACDVRFELDDRTLKLLREFVMRFQEELALNGTPSRTKDAPAKGSL